MALYLVIGRPSTLSMVRRRSGVRVPASTLAKSSRARGLGRRASLSKSDYQYRPVMARVLVGAGL